MNVLDSNTVIFYLGNKLEDGIVSSRSLVSIMTEMEVLSFPQLTEQQKAEASKFFQLVRIVNIDSRVKFAAIELRKKYKLKLPDAIICATAMSLDAELATADERLWSIPGLNCLRITPR